MEKIELSAEERAELKSLHKGVRDGRSRDRIKAILLLDDGYSPIETAHILLLEERTIRRWQEAYSIRKNITSYIFKECRVFERKLNKDELKSVEKYVEESLINDSKKVRLFIKNNFGVSYAKSSCIALLHELGFKYKQTTIIPSGLNPEKQAAFKKNYDEFISQLKEDEAVVFMDGMHPTHNLETGKSWIKEGQKKEVRTNSGRKRCNLNGFYNPVTQDIFVKDYASINAQATIDLYKELEAYYPNKASIYVVIDNARYYKNAEVRQFLKTSRIEPIYLPTYSPNLNLIERFWKVLKKEKISNQFYAKFSDFKHALLSFCNESSPEHKAMLKKSVGTKLHLLRPVPAN